MTDYYYSDTPEGRSIKEDIIPAIAHMRQLYPLRLEMILPSASLEGLFPGTSEVHRLEAALELEGLEGLEEVKRAVQTIECGNLQLTDKILDCIVYQ